MRHPERMRRHLRRRTRNPFFTTGGRRLRALEIGGGDPDGQERVRASRRRPARSRQRGSSELTHLEAIERGLRVMDTTALSLCMDNRLPIHVFELAQGNIRRVAAGERIGTIIRTP
jgi:uridylate kinase